MFFVPCSPPFLSFFILKDFMGYNFKIGNAKIVTFDRFPAEYRNMNYSQREPLEEAIPPEDWDLSRLEWLCFWKEYAIKNCEYPVFKNT
jgi:hypothetical protein